MFKNFFAAFGALGASAAFAQASAPVTAVTVSAAEVGFFAGLMGFIAGWGIFFLVALALLGIFAEHGNSRGWSIFWLLLAAGVAWITFNISLTMLAIGAVGYVVIGLFWSFWRYKRHATKVVEKNQGATSQEKERALRDLHPKQMLGTITAWILIWPFSMIENVVGDLLTAIQMLVTKFFRGVYHRVYDSAVAALK